MQRVCVGVGVDGDGADAQGAAGARDAYGDLAAIGDKDRFERRGYRHVGRRLSRNARKPSCPSGLTR